ncbi:MAG: tetratricopeptide repeat protein [Cyanobacteria bacterium P01_C01_bin.120]
MGKRVIGSVLAVLLGTGTLLPEHTRVEAQIVVAQVPPQTVTGRLDENSQILSDDGSYYNIHTFEGMAGETISIEMVSAAFDTYLILVGPDGVTVVQDDDSGGNTNARIVTTLPSTGPYQIIANSYSSGETGEYTLTWRAAELEEVGQNAALRRATELNQQAIQLDRQGRYGEAEPLFQQALAIHREQLGEDHPDVATSLNNLAELYRVQGRYGEAEPLYQQALAIRREQLGNRHPDVATSLNNLAGLYQDQGRHDEAEPLFLEALAIRREKWGSHHPGVAYSLNNLSLLYQDQGRYDEAEPLYLEALAILRKQLLDDAAVILNNLAELYRVQGRYGEAEPLYLEALAIRREQLENRHPDVATSLNNLGLLYQDRGRYGEAEPLYLEALAIRREQLGNRHPDVAQSLNNLGLLYQDQGRYGEAEPLYLEALAIRREQLGNRHPDVAHSLSSLAEFYRIQGSYGEAEPLYLEALAILREQWGNRHPDVAASLNNLALFYHNQRSYSNAEALYLEALTIHREQMGESHPLVANIFNNLAGVYQDQGSYGNAEALHLEALTIRREQIGERHPLVAQSLNNLAGLYWAQGKTAQSVDIFQEGLTIQEWNLESNLATLTEAQRQNYAATLSGSTDWAISLSLQTSEAHSLGLTTLLRRKGRLLDAGSNSLQRLRENLTPADQVVLDNWVNVRQQLATLTFDPPASLSPQQYRQQLTQLEAEANELEKTLTQRSDLFRVETKPVEIEAVQAEIPADGVLVEYIRYRPFDAQAEPASRWGESRYAAYLLFPSGDIRAIDLGLAADIDTAVLSLASALEDANQQIDEIQRRAQTLDGLVMAPLRAQLSSPEHLLISPDGTLNQIPFEVLHSDGQYLVEAFEISYLNSGRDLLKFDIIPPSEQPSAIFAAPNYGQVRTKSSGDGNGRRSVDLESLSVEPLEYAFREGRAVNALLPDAEFLTGPDATETALKQVRSPRLLHIATHGLFLEDTPRRQRGGETEEVPIENPLLRAMLAMEGFNARSSGEEDGIFTALEAANLNLYGTQLVVLSACETGQGEVVNGEGVYGLRRAFAMAGAESLMMSLWKVEDEGTQDLMVRYYENLLSGMGRSEALRDVQLEMINSDDNAHPYYWTAFVLAGNWRSL